MNPFTHPNRRQFLGGTLGGFFALALAHRHLLGATIPTGKAKRCLVLWMEGGPSQLETFDPKPGRITGGPTQAIETAAPGLKISQNFPHLAKRMQHLSVIRNLTSREGEHERARYFLHTGYPFVEAFPRPALGSMLSTQLPPNDVPNYVTINAPGFGPAFLGADHGPFSIEDPAEARRLLRVIESRQSRLELTRMLGQEFDRTHAVAPVERRLAVMGRIEKLIETPFSRALDLESEPAASRAAYGEGEMAKSMLLARRLLETGVPFVEVVQRGWDTHADNFNAVNRLCAALDQPWAALMDDLASRGLLEETLIVWMGDFGRTPTINGNNGRDHFPDVTPVVIGGAGITGGVAIGATNAGGTEIEGGKHRVPDLFATIFAALGLDPGHQFRTDFGSMSGATDDGEVIAGLQG